jgi:hypothetical protein
MHTSKHPQCAYRATVNNSTTTCAPGAPRELTPSVITNQAKPHQNRNTNYPPLCRWNRLQDASKFFSPRLKTHLEQVVIVRQEGDCTRLVLLCHSFRHLYTNLDTDKLGIRILKAVVSTAVTSIFSSFVHILRDFAFLELFES